ncbi:hypothetical protein RRG08_046209 [Elysia crispata]|uniref:Uncharacterized protein n=1 Tax=Elysia crispata TaxID=231223 RepID=A0AAE1CJH6_9GAST|nr:hypothetical protein RRG08_046209 [Elysia crispata]
MSEWLRAYLKFAGRLKEVRITLPVKHDLKPSNRRRMILGAGYIAYVWPLDRLRHTINLDKMQAGILCLVLISPEYLCVDFTSSPHRVY